MLWRLHFPEQRTEASAPGPARELGVRLGWVAAAALVSALCAVLWWAGVATPVARVACVGALLLASGAALLRLRHARARVARGSRTPARDGHLTLTDEGLFRGTIRGAMGDAAATREKVISFDAPFGVTVMLGENSGSAWLGITTALRTCLLRVKLSGTESTIARRASCTVPEDFELAAPLLDEADALALLAALELRSRDAFGRVLLTGSQGERIVLDGSSLRVEDHAISLARPYECRHFSFCEPLGRVGGLYDATWLKQGDEEIVLVAAHGSADWGALDAPPPAARRYAVDRAFLPSLRSALIARPRSSRRPEGVASAPNATSARLLH